MGSFWVDHLAVQSHVRPRYDLSMVTYILDRYGHARGRRRKSALRGEFRLHSSIIPVCHESNINKYRGTHYSYSARAHFFARSPNRGIRFLFIKISPDGSSTLMMPWSGENLVFLDEAHPGETSRPRRDKARACAKRIGLSRLDVFSTRVTGFEVRTVRTVDPSSVESEARRIWFHCKSCPNN